MYFPTLYHNSCALARMIIANWKAQGSEELCQQYIRNSAEWYGINIVVCPPYPYLKYFTNSIRSDFLLGAQTCSSHEDGAYTGEVTCRMLKEFNCNYVIIGHSERRAFEDNDVIEKKLVIAKKYGLKTILCIGEPITIKQEGYNAIISYLNNQLRMIKYCDIIAYEPIWAIGTGLTPDLEELSLIIRALKQHTTKPIIYGGSVDPSKVQHLGAIQELQGLLIGSASLRPSEFSEIVYNYKGTKISNEKLYDSSLE